jgi:hypothetical protein
MDEHARDAIVEYLRGQASWRAWKAEEYPEDARNARSAEHLTALAEYVQQLPDNDENLRKLEVAVVDAVDVWMPGERAAWLVSRFGFDAPVPVEDFGEFLAELAETEIGDIAKTGIEELEGLLFDEEA